MIQPRQHLVDAGLLLDHNAVGRCLRAALGVQHLLAPPEAGCLQRPLLRLLSLQPSLQVGLVDNLRPP